MKPSQADTLAAVIVALAILAFVGMIVLLFWPWSWT